MEAQTAGMVWANLVHLSFNMWCDHKGWGPHTNASPDLRFDDSLWNDLVEQMAGAGLNMVVIDLGDGVQYAGHPEIAVNGAWSVSRLTQELARLRAAGLEPIPKLNFSTAHDHWLGEYSRMVSTPAYYRVCRDLIREVCDLFEGPRFFHLGMDEEQVEHQRTYEYLLVRQHDLWWRDLGLLLHEVDEAGSRPWIWSDYAWHNPEVFYARMPRRVVQSNWYYGADFSAEREPGGPRRLDYAQAYHACLDLDEQGYSQVPTGSNHSVPTNFEGLAAYCRDRVSGDRLLGFMQTTWMPTLQECRARHEAAIEQVGRAREAWVKSSTTPG